MPAAASSTTPKACELNDALIVVLHRQLELATRVKSIKHARELS